MFSILSTPLNTDELKQRFKNKKAGAFVSFEGWVRNHNDGKMVHSLEYEAYSELSKLEADKIFAEAKNKFDLLEVVAVHREGHLQIGELAVWVGVSAKHRDAAFKACRYVIDEIKSRLPIWKKEHYVDGEAVWVNCKACSDHAHAHPFTFTETEYYEKQISLNGMGRSGQKKLKQAKVLVVGAGGLGCPSLTYLVSAGVGEILIIDADQLEVSNLHRQTLYSYSDLGLYKAELAQKRLSEINPFVKIQAVTKRLNLINAKQLIQGCDLVLDCTDNFETKFLLHDACYLNKVPLIQASIYQAEGQLQVFDFKDSDSSCMRCVWSEMPDSSCVGNCAEVGVMGVVPGILGTMQATEALNYLLGKSGEPLRQTILVDLHNWEITKINRNKNKSCTLCGTSPTINSLIGSNYGRESFEVELSEITDAELQNFKCIDIRNPVEFAKGEALIKFSPEQPMLFICQKGIRSKKYVRSLVIEGFTRAYSLYGGVDALKGSLKERIDPLLQCRLK